MASPVTPFPTQARRAIDFEWPLPTTKDYLKRRLAFLFAVSPKIKGVDLAPDYQKDEILDVAAMRAAGYLFAIVQVNRGLYVHPNLMEFCAPLIDGGMPIITYALFYGTMSGIDQAYFHLMHAYKIWQAQGMKLPAMLDIELRDGVSIATRVSRSEDWFRDVSLEVKPVKYCSPALNSELLGNAPLLGYTIGHVAHWTPALEPAIPGGWTKEKTLFWQYGVALKNSWCPAVPGMKSDVDVNYFFGTLGEFLSLATNEPIASESVSPSPEPEEEMDLTKVKAARDLLNQFIAENEGIPPQPSPPSSSPSPSSSPQPDNTWTMTVKADPRAKTWTYQIWNENQGKLVDKMNEADPPKPIMQEYLDKNGNRLTLPNGMYIQTYKDLTDADGTINYYQLYNMFGDRGQKLYVAQPDMTKPY